MWFSLRKMGSLMDRILTAGSYCCAFLIFLAWLVMLMEICCRKFLNHPLVWSVEAAEFMMLYTLFLGAAWVLREEHHIQIDILLDAISERKRALLTAINSVLGLGVSALLVWYGAANTIVHYQDDIRTFTAMELPQWPFILIIPIGSFFLTLQFARRFHQNIQKFRAGPVETE